MAAPLPGKPFALIIFKPATFPCKALAADDCGASLIIFASTFVTLTDRFLRGVSEATPATITSSRPKTSSLS